MASVRRWAVRGGVGALLAASMAAAGFGIADAASSSSAGHAPGNPTHASSAAATPKSSSPSGAGWSGAPPMGGRGPGREPGPFGLRGGVGSITAITTNSVTVRSQLGGTRTILTTPKTVYVEAMSVVPRTDLKVGENVGVLVRPVRPPGGLPHSWSPPSATPTPGSSAGGSATSAAASASASPTAAATEPTAVAIEILVPRLDGRVVSVSSGKIVVEDPSGLQQTLVTTSSTKYRELNTTVPASAVAAGENVIGFGTVATDRTELDASTVAVVGPLAGGKVTGVSGSTITVKSPRGTVRISTSSATIFRSNGGASSLAGVKAGDLVIAVGLPSGTSGFTASGVWFGALPGPAGALRIAFGLGSPALGAPTGGSTGVFGAGGFAGRGGSGAVGFGGFGDRHGGFAPGSPSSTGGAAAPGAGATTT